MPPGVSRCAASDSLRTISAPIVMPIASQNSRLIDVLPVGAVLAARVADGLGVAAVGTVLRTP